jgi:hypothetical protein
MKVIMSIERFLIHGPLLHDLTDFLYFDKVVYPTTLAYVCPAGMPRNYQGHRLRGTIPADVQDRLRNAGLIEPPGGLLPEIDFDKATKEEMAHVIKEMELLRDVSVRYLDLPRNQHKHTNAIQQFLIEIDSSTRHLAELALRKDKRIVAKYYANDAEKVLRSGKHSVLSVIFSNLPSIDPESVPIDDLIDFLSDDETKKKRRRLFDWQNGIENAIDKGDLKIEHVHDRIATLIDDYTTWIDASDLSSGISIAEFLLNLSDALIQGLTVVGIPKAVKTILNLGTRKVELQKAELEARGREVAYIVHCQRKFTY